MDYKQLETYFALRYGSLEKAYAALCNRRDYYCPDGEVVMDKEDLHLYLWMVNERNQHILEAMREVEIDQAKWLAETKDIC